MTKARNEPLPFPSLGKRRERDDPGARTERLLWLFTQLWRTGIIDKRTYDANFGMGPKAFSRDIQSLRDAERLTGMTLSKSVRGRVSVVQHRAPMLRKATDEAARLLHGVASALGPPVAAVISPLVGEAFDDPPFFRIAAPRFALGTTIGETYALLERAHRDDAMVAFTYTTKHGITRERRVEPYCCVQLSGRSYLVGFDRTRNDWRCFALDAISGVVRRAGTVSKRRTPPFDVDDVLGFIRGDEPPTAVTIRIAKELAAAVRSRRWQHGQRISERPDGSLDLTIVVTDFQEAARWTMSFGNLATIIAPPGAVATARELLNACVENYGDVHAARTA